MTSPSVLRRSLGRDASKRPVRQAVLQEPNDGFFHVTALRNLPGIKKHGLLVNPPKRTYGKEAGPVATIGGIYLVPAGYRLETVTDMVCSDARRSKEVAVLTVRVEAGTRFCLDEDEVVTFLGLPGDALAELERDVFRGSPVLAAAIEDCGRRNFYCSRRKLDKWSCELAKAIDQTKLSRFMIRVFSPPTIVGIARVKCVHGDSVVG